MECLAVALKELKIPLKEEISSLKCSGNLQHIGYCRHGVLYVYHVLLNNGKVEMVQDNVLEFGWLTADTGSEAYLMESQHLIVANSNHDIIWYKVTNVDKETIQVSLVCSLAAAYMSSVSMKGSNIDTLSLFTTLQADNMLVLINGRVLCQLNIKMNNDQLDVSVCCDLSQDMTFMEAILGIQHSNRFYKLLYRRPLLLAVTSDYSTLVVYNITSAASKSVGAVSVDTLIRQNHGSVMPSSARRIDYYDVASDLDTIVICLGLSVLVFKLSTYFTLNKEHLSPRFIHKLADRLVVRQSHGQGINYEEEEDRVDYGVRDISNHSSWQRQRTKLLHMINAEQVAMTTKYPNNTRWYEEPSILYEEQVNTVSNHSVPVISGLSSMADLNASPITIATSNNSYVHTVLPMASQKVAKENSDEVVAIVMYTPSTVMVYYGGKSSTTGARGGIILTNIIVCALDSKEYANCKISKGSMMMGVANACIPIAVMCQNSLVVPILGLTHQEFVQKVLIYESAVAAETVCRLNQWDRCFLPINALETALELRQLDTVNFFLNPKEPTVPDDEPALPVTLLDKAIDLLIRAIKKNLTEHQNSQFSSQLLHMTITFVNNLMKESVKDGPSLEKLNQYMLQLRGCLLDIPKHSLELDDLTSSLTDFGLSRKNAAMWSDLSREEVLKDALLKGCLPEAQYYLITNGTLDPVVTSPQVSLEDSLLEAAAMTTATIATSDYTVRSLLSAGVGYAIEALINEDAPLTCNLLLQMGLSIKHSLRYLCFNTFSKQLRSTIVEELRERDWLSMNELEALEYLQLLEMVYPVRSFEAVKSFHFKSKVLNYQSTSLPELNTVQLKISHIPTIGNLDDLYPETFGGDYSIPMSDNDVTEKSNTGYLHVCLQLILTWDQTTREQILLEGNRLRSTAAPTNQQQLSWDNKIQYYSSHNCVPQLLDTITQLLVAISNGSESSHQLLQLVDHFALMTSYSNDFIRDQLIRQGIIFMDEVKDFNKLMYRIGRTHCLLSQPHPLAHISQLDVTVAQCCSFHSLFIEYCVKNEFVSLLYHYLDTYNLAVANGNSSEEIDSDLVAQHCWLDVMLRFRNVAQTPLDPNAMFMASLSSSRLLLGQQGGTIMGMLTSGHPLITMATLMYSNISLQEAMEVGQDWYVDSSSLKSALAAYPKLQDAVFPLLPSNCITVKAQDITVYKLLQGNVSFNVARLFLWQPTNTLTKEGDYLRGVSGSSDMPHFSLQSLAVMATQHQHLTYRYHLLQGQPVFAYANFVAAKKQLRRNFNKEVNRGVSKAYRMAMSDFTNITLTSSCIIFTELLSHDSTKLRVHLSTAQRLLKYYDQFANDPDSISQQFFEMRSNPSCAQQVLTQLEVATAALVDAMEIELCSIEALECWQLIGSFCRLHGLVGSKRFLITCAQRGKWLPMMCHAQQLHLPPDELLLVIEHHFVESRIKEHLMLAVSANNWGTNELPLSPRSYHNSVMDQQRSHKTMVEKIKASPSKIKRQLNVRARYYSKMGLPMEVKTSATEQDHVISHDNTDNQQVDVAMVAADECDWRNELMADDLPADLFTVLFKCRQSSNCYQLMLAHAVALRQPLLAIFAACCEGANMIGCMCVWLCSSVEHAVVEKFVQLLNVIPPSQNSKKPEFTKELQYRHWNVVDLAVMIAVAIHHKMTSPTVFKLLFKYFDPENVLIKYMTFYENFKFKADHITAMKYLQQFKNDLENESVAGIANDQQWTEDIANFVTAQLLVDCCTSSERSQLLKILSDSKFASTFQHKTIDYGHLYHINDILSQADLCFDLSFTATLQFITPAAQLSLQDFYSVKVRVDSEYVIEALLDKKEFAVATAYAHLVGAASDQITVREVQYKLDVIKFSELWKEEDTRIEFWLSANQAFQEKTVSPELAANFFEGTMATTLPHYLTTMEQVLLLSLALQWHKKARQIDSKELKQREKEIWLSHIKCIAKATTEPQNLSWLQSKHKTMATSPASEHRPVEFIDWSLLALLDHHGPCALKELMTESDSNIDIGEKSQSLNKEEVDALETMLGRLLNAGRVNQAVKLSNLFEHSSPNLASVLCCIQLAQGKLSPDQLTPGVIKLLSTNPSSRGVVTVGSSQAVPSTSKSQEVIELMELLADRAPDAHHCCSIIIHCFRIALAIRHPYESIVSSDPLDTLTGLLNCNQIDRISLAENFVQVCQLSAEEIADYLCDCVTSALKQYQSLTHTSVAQQSLLTSALARTNSRLIVYNPRMSSSEFMELVQLCPDAAMLGCKLFAMINSSELASLSLQAELSVQVDLLIRAHDCFSIGCNIDGIAMVLELAHKLSDTLNKEKEFKLMVRLLTGIRRFREMSYIIDILVYNNEFETLLSKNVEKEEQFKTALLDYLKKYHSNDTDKLHMVAGKFLMHREQAKAIEEQAKLLVRSLKKRKLDASNPEVVKTLKNAYNYYQDAAVNYAEDDCLTNTEHCMSQARLVALQLSIMKNDIKVINLDNKAVLRFLQEHDTFYQALIVADAYKSRVPIEWSVNLYHRVILAGDHKYYNDYKCSLPLTLSLFQELASKYRRDQHKTQQSVHNMRRILNDLPDLSLRHKLLHELGYGYQTNDQATFNPEAFINDIARL